MLTSQFIARFVRARGVRRIFGHPGSDTIDLIQAMAEEDIEFVLTHHENTAAFMAAASGELTGVPGVVVVTKGPGVTNIASGLAAAHLDRRPIIVLSATVDREYLRTNPHQDVPLVALGGLMAKLSEELTGANAVELLPRAYRTAITPRPGSVYLPISPRQAVAPVGVPDAAVEQAIAAEVRPVPGETPDVSAAAALVARSARPLAVVGVGVAGADASADVVRGLEALGAPACVTLQAVGQVPCDHPLYLGMYGWHGTPVKRMIDTADLILTLGLDGWDIVTPYRAGVPIVSLDSVDANDRTFQPVTVGLTGDLGQMVRALAARGRGPRGWGVAEAQACYREIRERELGVSAEHAEADGVPPQRVYSELRALTPRDTILTADAGSHKSMAAQAWPAYGPRSFIVSNGLSPMGFALGAAMGAKLAQPERTVVTVVGDGGFLMYAGELATWARLGLPMLQIVMVDHSLTQVKTQQERRGFGTAATSFRPVNFGDLARSFGIEAVRAENTAAFRAAVVRGLAAQRPIVIETILDAREYRRVPTPT